MGESVKFLYHYFEKGTLPFRTLASLPFTEAKEVMLTELLNKAMIADLNPAWVDRFLQLRYDRDKTLRAKFVAIGGKPERAAPVYFTLGPNAGMRTWFEHPDYVQIPVEAFDPGTVSYTYGDSFAIFDPALDTGEAWWGNVYRYEEILGLIAQYGFPEDPAYDMLHRVFPKDRHINHYLKFVEAHVWSDAVLSRYL